MNHTPGPWTYKYSNWLSTWDVQSPEGQSIAGVWNGTPETRRLPAEANVRLIAAAPDLLAACKEFVRKVERGEARSVRTYAQMKAAIAKAEGGES